MPRQRITQRSLRPFAALAATCALVGAVALPASPAVAAAAPARPAGLDVSAWQSAGPANTCAPTGINWARVAGTGRRFVMIRATRTKTGVIARDACFARNWAGARGSGLYRGAYHYAIPSLKAGSAVRDARVFVSVTGPMQGAGDLPPVLDLEVTGGLNPVQLKAWAANWLRTVRALTGRQPMIYTSPGFWRHSMANTTAFRAFPLWIAHWGTPTPSIPGGWPTWTMQQYSASGRVVGISGDVDLNVFQGSAAALYAFAHPGTAPSTSTSGTVAYRGSPWQIAGVLRTARKAIVPNASVTLYRQSTARAWTRIATTRTNASGSYRFALRPTTAATYRVRYNGGVALAASWSAVRQHTIRNRTATRVTAAASAATIKKGTAVRLAGKLTETRGTPLVNKSVVVYQRVGSGPWRAAQAMRTSARSGWYAVTVHPSRATTFKVVFAGSISTLPSTSTARTVAVR